MPKAGRKGKIARQPGLCCDVPAGILHDPGAAAFRHGCNMVQPPDLRPECRRLRADRGGKGQIGPLCNLLLF